MFDYEELILARQDATDEDYNTEAVVHENKRLEKSIRSCSSNHTIKREPEALCPRLFCFLCEKQCFQPIQKRWEVAHFCFLFRF